MTVVKNAVSIGLKLENCYLVEGGGGGVGVIDFWWGGKNWGGGDFLGGTMNKFLAGMCVCACVCGGGFPHPPSRKSPLLITFAPESF